MWALYDRRTGWVYRIDAYRPVLYFPFCDVTRAPEDPPAPAGQGLCFDPRPGSRQRWFVDPARNPNRRRAVHRAERPRIVPHWYGASVTVLTAGTSAVAVLHDPGDPPTRPLEITDSSGKRVTLGHEELVADRVVPLDIEPPVAHIDGLSTHVAIADAADMPPDLVLTIGDSGIRVATPTPRGVAMAAAGEAPDSTAALVASGPRRVDEHEGESLPVEAADCHATILRAACGERGIFVDLRRDGYVRFVATAPGFYIMRGDLGDVPVDFADAGMVRPTPLALFDPTTIPRRISFEDPAGEPIPVVRTVSGTPPAGTEG